jgi:hypothetical protein
MPDGRSSAPSGAHPSGALFCQRCGSAASLVAASGPDWARQRVHEELLCQPCSVERINQAERFALTLVLRPAPSA